MSGPYRYAALGQDEPGDEHLQPGPPAQQAPAVQVPVQGIPVAHPNAYAPVTHAVSVRQSFSLEPCGYLRPAFGVYKLAPGAFSAGVGLMFLCGIVFGGLATTAAVALGPVALIVDFCNKLVQNLVVIALFHLGLSKMRGSPESLNASLSATFTRKEIILRCAGYQAGCSVLQLATGLIAAGIIGISMAATGNPDPQPMVVLTAAVIAWVPLAFALFLAMYALPLLADGVELAPAVRLSCRGVAADMFGNLLLALSALLVALAGMLLFGIGMLVSLPVALLMSLHGYCAIFDARPMGVHAAAPSLV
eukprot:tig00020904_g15236.t1